MIEGDFVCVYCGRTGLRRLDETHGAQCPACGGPTQPASLRVARVAPSVVQSASEAADVVARNDAFLRAEEARRRWAREDADRAAEGMAGLMLLGLAALLTLVALAVSALAAPFAALWALLGGAP